MTSVRCRRRTSASDTAPCAAYADLSSDKERLGLPGRDRALFLWLAGRECARAFVARTDVETIQLAEVGVADDLKAPQQSQAERTTDSASDFHGKWKAAQRFDANLDPRFLLSGFHQDSE